MSTGISWSAAFGITNAIAMLLTRWWELPTGALYPFWVPVLVLVYVGIFDELGTRYRSRCRRRGPT